MTSQPLPRIQTMIVDDEPLARTNIERLLERDPEIDIVGQFGSGREAIAAIRTSIPDLLFLDVQMPEYDGFDVIEALGTFVPRAVVFVTAYDQYAVRAFEMEALDYLLKPIQEQRFCKVLSRAKEQIYGGQGTAVWRDRIVVKNAGNVVFLQAQEIQWIEAASYYVALHVSGKTYMLRRTMNELEHDLNPDRFCRIHRSTIVNLDCVHQLETGPDGEYEVVLRDKTRLKLSRAYRKAFQERLHLL
ncbi:MAG TPA: LytTR family DNA-binding domain-containing protein [Candidatus Angelobacter sp.]|nr:LytTR family DNA-binding domain-containing protein [Candidatus Angelobacter sp.]